MQATMLMEKLLRIQDLQLIQGKNPESHPELKALRADMPPQILGHADRLFAREKKALALIERTICTACRMGLPTGTILDVKRGHDIQICGNCGRYLIMAPEPPPPPPDAKPAKRKRAVKKPAAA